MQPLGVFQHHTSFHAPHGAQYKYRVHCFVAYPPTMPHAVVSRLSFISVLSNACVAMSDLPIACVCESPWPGSSPPLCSVVM